jgi:AraC family transcriptional regulator
MQRVFSFVEENLGNQLSLGVLSSVACMSRFHFARTFRLRTGYSPMAYVLRRRVERACVEIRRNPRRICDVSAELGFCDQSHFTRHFRRIVGVTPGNYAMGLHPSLVGSTCLQNRA